MSVCKHCGLEFPKSSIANHSRWCKSNPAREYYEKHLEDLHRNYRISDENRLARNKKISDLHKSGFYKTVRENTTYGGWHHTDKVKRQISEGRKKWIANNTEKHGWNLSKGKSVPAENLKERLRREGIKFVEEYRPLTDRLYSLDIAFPERMTAIEVNGNQHYELNGSLRPYYRDRHRLIESAGWKLYEVHFSKVFSDEIMDTIRDILNDRIVDTSFDYDKWIISPKKRKDIENKRREEKKKRIEEIKNQKIEELIQSLLDSDIDFSRFGWVERASRLLGIQPQKVSGWMKRYMSDFYEERCFKRKR